MFHAYVGPLLEIFVQMRCRRSEDTNSDDMTKGAVFLIKHVVHGD